MLFGSWAGKSVRFSRPGLAVCDNRKIIAVKEEREEWCECMIKNSALVCKILEDMIIMESLVGDIPVSSSECQVAEVV